MIDEAKREEARLQWMPALLARKDLVESALVYTEGSHTFEDIAAGIDLGQFKLLVAPNSLMLLEVIEYPQRKDLHVFLAAGKLEELEKMTPAVEEFGRRLGCKFITLSGRRGWERTYLRGRGWKQTSIVMSKEL